MTDPSDRLQGSWKVRRVRGLLPPGVTKEIDGASGRTLVFGVHFGAFQIQGDRFVYSFWPIVDILEPEPGTGGGPIQGCGTVFGVPFCRFRLER